MLVGGVVEGFVLLVPLLVPFNADVSLTITPVPFSDFICIVMVNKLCFQTAIREFYAKKRDNGKKINKHTKKMFFSESIKSKFAISRTAKSQTSKLI